MTQKTLRRHIWRSLTISLVLSFGLAACGTSSGPVPPDAPIVTPSAAAASAAPSQPATVAPTVEPEVGARTSSSAFTVAVIVDTLTQALPHDQAQAIINEAGGLLRQLTPFGIEMVDFVEDGGGGSTNEMAGRYVNTHLPTLPNGLVIFSLGDEGRAKLNGGYSFSLAGPAGFRNSFAAPSLGPGQIYVAVVDPAYKYAACGYGGTDTVQSGTALAGECGNEPGAPCIQQNGYSMCASAVGTLYMMTPTYYAASMIIHQLLHPFAPEGERDHYNTPECNTRMGYPPAFFDLQESQYHNDLCPYVYDQFVKSHQP